MHSPPAVYRYVLLAGVAFGAGLLNAVAGGGSFFSFPALLGIGLPPVNANATNSVAIWPGQITSILAFRRELHATRRLFLPAMAAAGAGGAIGAITLLLTSQSVFLRLVPWLLLLATALFALSGPAQRRLQHSRSLRQKPLGRPEGFSPGLFLSLAVVSFYIGYFGAGSGFLIITVLSLAGFSDLNEINALKVLCNTAANGVAVAMFIVARAVFWNECLVMLLFAAAGGYFGGMYSRRLNQRLLRAIIIATGALLSVFYFWKTT